MATRKMKTKEGADVAAVATSCLPHNTLCIERKDGESDAAAIVRAAANPVARGAITARKLTSYLAEDADITTYVQKLREQTTAFASGDLSGVESMLVTQAMTLDALFNHMSMKALETSSVPAKEALLRLALKAQAQCSGAAKVLGELKNPRAVAFIRQQNNANGPQQVNNGVRAPSQATTRSGAERPGRSTNLLEERNGARMDNGTSGKAGRGDQALEAMGAVNRADKRRG